MSDDPRKNPPPTSEVGVSGHSKPLIGAAMSVDTLPTEDPSEFKTFRINYIKDLAPDGDQELDLALQIVRLSWRLKKFGIFFQAQDALKQYGPLIRGTLEETQAAYAQFESSYVRGLYEEAIPRLALARKQEEASLRDTCKTIEDPALREALENIVKRFDVGAFLSDQDVHELLLQAVLPPEMKKIKDKEKEQDKVRGSPIDLAYVADALTVQTCIAELELREALERALDRALARYWKLKDEKRKVKEAQKRRSRLLPPY